MIDDGYLASSQGEATKNDDDKFEFLWVRIKGKANKADVLVGVCRRPCNQDEEVNELFFKQLADTSQVSALVLLGDLNLPDVSWKLNTVERRQSRKFLECLEEKFLTWVTTTPCNATSWSRVTGKFPSEKGHGGAGDSG
ncbi:hypothetical protein HGM15179_000470 [Zosterops borbonicus]|uniref:Endonuclease/exonuclease/phosphatase domain-containing protein n=1 Tax=Zosterops borbonicus TaxID=364589 RepID=A0A8K1GWF0_9PASS|nr:hypothetical protein HGM15179_000470 [Zosterops borbonicus]